MAAALEMHLSHRDTERRTEQPPLQKPVDDAAEPAVSRWGFVDSRVWQCLALTVEGSDGRPRLISYDLSIEVKRPHGGGGDASEDFSLELYSRDSFLHGPDGEGDEITITIPVGRLAEFRELVNAVIDEAERLAGGAV